MNIRWRAHEIALGIVITIEFIIATILRGRNPGPTLIKIFYEKSFAERKVQFHYFRNVLLPDLSMALTMLLCLIVEHSIPIGAGYFEELNRIVNNA